MIRFIIAAIFVVLYCIVSVPILLIMTLIRMKYREKAEFAMLRVVQWAFKAVLFIAGTRVTTIGYERIPDEAVLFIGNHQSFFDTVISYSQMKNRCGYIAKNSLERIPILSWNMKFLRCLFLDREDIKQGLAVIHQAIDNIGEGVSMFVYPEGTRNRSGISTQLLPFHKGSFKVAQRTGCAIVPVAFNNADDVFERHFPRIKKAHVIVEYCEPIYYKELTREEQKHIDDYVKEKMLATIIKNEELV
ncbi:MAG: lysophospholipid acyltransferase family protein [Lachnospiraceae bacterium]|nr:lysophospholipid acyltransferase family protein [Lachnospiraceae bacterium]